MSSLGMRSQATHTPALVNSSYIGPTNFITYFGILFLSSLLGSANRDLDDNAFVFRDKEHGIDMDLMTNPMWATVGKDTEALLDYSTFTKLADHTFQTFFQQFVNSGLSLAEDGLICQSMNDKSIEYLSRLIDANGTFISKCETAPAQSISTSMSTRTRILYMNTIATYLSAAILVWPIGTTFIIICMQRKYMSSMIRDVQLIADMLLLVAGSDNFLELVQERGVALKRDREAQTMLRWFKDRDGNVRWGNDVVGRRDPVQWVDAPETGNHILEKSVPKAGWLVFHVPYSHEHRVSCQPNSLRSVLRSSLRNSGVMTRLICPSTAFGTSSNQDARLFPQRRRMFVLRAVSTI